MRARMLLAAIFFASPSISFGTTLSSTPLDTPTSQAQTDQFIDSANAISDDLNCRDFPGRRLCQEIRRFDNLILNCTGNSCYSLWDQQKRQIDRIEDWYYDHFSGRDFIERDLAQLSKSVSERLCIQRLTGDRDYLLNLAIKYNNLLSVLYDLQLQSDISVPYTCRFEMTP